MKIAAIVLAAGASTRMGQPKQMLDIRGEQLLVRTVKTFLQAGVSPVVVVLGSDRASHRKPIQDLPVAIADNPDWMKGMGTSIKTGLQHLMKDYPEVESAILSVCDQPLLSKEIICSLAGKFSETGKPIVASEYGGVPGVPVLFHRTYFGALAKLPDDQGAKKLILRNLSDVAVVQFPGGATDLDTMEDYESFRGK